MPLYLNEISQAPANCNLSISIGTSGNVSPASFCRRGEETPSSRGRTEPGTSEGATLFDDARYGKAGEIVPEFINELLGAARRAETSQEPRSQEPCDEFCGSARTRNKVSLRRQSPRRIRPPDTRTGAIGQGGLCASPAQKMVTAAVSRERSSTANMTPAPSPRASNCRFQVQRPGHLLAFVIVVLARHHALAFTGFGLVPGNTGGTIAARGTGVTVVGAQSALAN